MKTVTHENMKIEDFNRFFISLKREHPEIMGAEWDEKNRKLKIFYEDGATELTDDAISALKIPTVLRFKKKTTLPKLDTGTVVIATGNEVVVETFDVEATRKEIEKKLTEFEEVK
jgi:hypothetical protein